MSPQQRGIAVLLANSGLMSAGFYMLIPLLSVHLTRDLGYSGAAAGAVLAVRQLTQQGLMLFGGALADRVGYRRVIVAGLLVRSVGFLGFGLGDSLPLVLLAAIVAGLGGALFEATGKAALASLAPPEERPRLFSLSAITGSIGTGVGPLLGTVLLRWSFAWVGLMAGAFFFVAFAVSALLLPPLSGYAPGERAPTLGQTLRTVGQHRTFLVFTALLTGFWLLYNQVYVAVPLRAVQVTGGAGVVGVLYTINALAALALQYPLVRLATRRMTAATAVALGVATMGLGLGLMGLATPGTLAVPALAVGIAVYAAGRALAEPMKDVVTAALAPAGSIAAFFGVAFLALAVGGSVGNYLGGWLFDVATATQLYLLPWVVFAAFGAAMGAGLLAFSRYTRQRLGATRGANTMAVYELRTYDILPGKMPDINARFSNHTMRLFKRHGIEVVGFWQHDEGDAGQLIYVCAFDSEAKLKEAWAGFRADPEWNEVKTASERNGPLVRQVTSVIMQATPYSPIR